MSATFEGTLRVGAPSTFAAAHLATPTATFVQRCPALRIELVLSGGPSLAPRDGRVDIHLRIDPPTLPREQDEEHRILAPDRLVLCAAPSTLRARGIPFGPQDLARHDVIARRSGAKVAFHGGPSVGLVATAHVIADEDGFVRAAALSGLGVAALPASLVAAALDDGRLVEVLGDQLASDLAVIAVTSKEPPTLVRAFLDHLAAEWSSPPWSAALAVEEAPSLPPVERSGRRLPHRDGGRLRRVASLYDALDPAATAELRALLAGAELAEEGGSIAIGTKVRLAEDRRAAREVTLVYPWDAEDERVSVLSPLGRALLGLPVGASLVVPGGHGPPRAYVVEAILDAGEG